jgi:UDP-N-acetylmuramoylalanine--D-glutamate ligase
MTPPSPASRSRPLEGLERVVVAGFGRSGQAAAALLSAQGLSFTVVDARPEREHADALDALPDRPLFVPESDAAAPLAAADLIVLSPGIDPRRQPYAAALAAGVPSISEIELGWRWVRSPLVAVTGSNGKSTVTSLIGTLLEGSGLDARVCGNIGTPLSAALEDPGPDTRFVVEVSSFQLEHTDSFAPDVGVLLNVTPDHQDRYDDHAAYRAAKERLFAFQAAGADAVLCAGDPDALDVARRLAARGDGPRVILAGDAPPDLARTVPDTATVEKGRIVVRLGGAVHRLGPAEDLPLPGPHNLANCLAAVSAALCAGARRETMEASLAAFRPLPHRLEPVGERDGVRFIDDSKATNVESARMALRSFPAGRVLVILGGRDKGGNFAALAAELGGRARAVYAIGEAGPRIAEALATGLGKAVPVHILPGLAEAVPAAAAVARAGDVVLLAPACASFDAYAGFEERGEHFRRLAATWIQEGRRGA